MRANGQAGWAAFATCLAFSGPALAASGEKFQIKPTAQLDIDYASYDEDSRQLDSGWSLRRAIIGVEGKVGDDWAFEAGYQMQDDGAFRPRDGKFRDVNVEYKGWDFADVTIGQFKVPFGLEESIGSTDISFIERALPVDSFGLSRRLGIGVSRKHANYTISTMVFDTSIDGDDRGFGGAVRVTGTPIQSPDTVVHLGLSGVTEKPRSKVDFDTEPEARVAGVDLVNTGEIEGVRRINRMGLEAAWRTGPFSVQAEWIRAQVQRAEKSNADLHGWYVGGSWVLTGEARPYKNGEFKRIKPAGRFGALELTARYSRVDLDDADIRGGKERNLTIGLTHYWNKHVRMMLNYIDVHSERRARTDNPKILLMRVQLAL